MNTRMTVVAAVAAAFVAGAAHAQPERPRDGRGREGGQRGMQPERRADRDLWRELLTEHTKIIRSVRHLENGVETVTESPDPALAEKIRAHAARMTEVIAAGGRVRVWDEVFRELSERGDDIKVAITPTERGVRIVETSEDPEVVALLRSHAMALNRFVRGGHDAAQRTTPRLRPGDPVPAGEVAIGGVPHRFLLAQPTQEGLETLEKAGVDGVINFRPGSEHPEYDEKEAARSAGLDYENLPYADAAGLTDALLDRGRKLLEEAEDEDTAIALHCRTGNRVGPVWAAYRVLDDGAPLERALEEARALGMKDPALEPRVRDYIERHAKGKRGGDGDKDKDKDKDKDQDKSGDDPEGRG